MNNSNETNNNYPLIEKYIKENNDNFYSYFTEEQLKEFEESLHLYYETDDIEVGSNGLYSKSGKDFNNNIISLSEGNIEYNDFLEDYKEQIKQKELPKSEIHLNEEYVRLCNNQSMYDRGTHIQNEANECYQKFIKCFNNTVFSENQKDIFEKRKDTLRDFITKSFNEYLEISSRFVPITVAGPAKYPSARMDKIMDRMNKKQEEIYNKIDKFYKNTEEMLNEQIPVEEMIEKYRKGYSGPISSDDKYVKEKLQAKLEYLEENHKKYIEYNKNARKNNEEPLAPYVLANSNQNIKSVKDRLKQLENLEKLNFQNYYFVNGEVNFDKEDNRIKIYFDEKPSDEVRENLKRHGFKWAPSNQCWQRKITPNAIYSTKSMFKDIGGLTIKKVYDCKDEPNIKL